VGRDEVLFLNENYVLVLAITFLISFYGRSMLLGELQNRKKAMQTILIATNR